MMCPKKPIRKRSDSCGFDMVTTPRGRSKKIRVGCELAHASGKHLNIKKQDIIVA